MPFNILTILPRQLTAITFVLLVLFAAATARAHEGPPYPVIVDQPVEDCLVSVWADPDLGTGTFYVMIDPANKQAEIAEPKVEVWVQPASERLPKVSYTAERQDIRNRMQLAAYPEFDELAMWTIGIRITPPGKQTSELTTQVEVTPQGLGPWDLLIYLFPFGLIGLLWGVGLMRRWKAKPETKTEQTEQTTRLESY
jgi:hypothetical protein